MSHLIATNSRYLARAWLLTKLDAISTESGYNNTPTVTTELPDGDVGAVTFVVEVGDDEVESNGLVNAQDYTIIQPFSIRIYVPAQAGSTDELARRAAFKAVDGAIQDARTALCSGVADLEASIPTASFEMGSAEGCGLTKFDGGEARGVDVTINCSVAYRARMEW